MATVDEYQYDSSDEEDVLNTIGNIPFEWYKDYMHVGYDVDGRKILKPPKEDQLQEFLKQMEDPNYWRTIKDNLTEQNVVLDDNEIDLVKRLRASKCPVANYNPYEDFIDFFSYEKMIHPIQNRPEPKAAFIPSLSEKRIVSKLVNAIKKSRLKPKPRIKKREKFSFNYDLWENNGNTASKRLERYIAAPKPQPPGHEESYNPPPEYLFTDEEKKEWMEQEPEDRKINFIPQKFASLRQVPAYSNFIRERFERSLDLYLCPRIRKNRINVRADDLIPQLPKPSDLRPFPSSQSILYEGHDNNVLCCSVEPAGQFIASGDCEGVLKIWEIMTGRCFKTLQFIGSIDCLCWCPDSRKSILAMIIDKKIYMLNIQQGSKQSIKFTDEYFDGIQPEEEIQDTVDNGDIKDNDDEDLNDPESSSSKFICTWHKTDRIADAQNWNKGVRIIIENKFEIKQIVWHQAGEYFSTVMPNGNNKSIIIHHLTKMKSQIPFRKIKDIVQCVRFHPTKAYFFVATKRMIRIYDLIKQQMIKKLIANCNEISSMAIHPGGDNLIVSSLDPRVQWFDLDLSNKPYKTMRYHKKAIRSLDFHQRYPLFASSSDDGTIVVCHGMVYDDLLQNALIVPVKVLRFNQIDKKMAAISSCVFHPSQPWLFAVCSKKIALFT
ncbi:hypothetical protein NH340_JMT05253 [Sarcoptes scabiei]|nr:hypothetical protein NH340_JMT05253 [Sarcoptes scabiei]